MTNTPEPEVLTKVRELEELLASITNAHTIFMSFQARGDISVLMLGDSGVVAAIAKRATRAQELLTELRLLVPYLVLSPDEAVPPGLVNMLARLGATNLSAPDDISGLEDLL